MACDAELYDREEELQPTQTKDEDLEEAHVW